MLGLVLFLVYGSFVVFLGCLNDIKKYTLQKKQLNNLQSCFLLPIKIKLWVLHCEFSIVSSPLWVLHWSVKLVLSMLCPICMMCLAPLSLVSIQQLKYIWVNDALKRYSLKRVTKLTPKKFFELVGDLVTTSYDNFTI